MQESVLDHDSLEVATLIAGYVSKKLKERSKCLVCLSMLSSNKDGIVNDKYLNLMSRGGLTVPCADLADFVQRCFALLDYASELMQKHNITNVKDVARIVLEKFAPMVTFVCDDHVKWGFQFRSKPVINSFFKNKVKVANESVRKDAVAEFKKCKRRKTC